MREYGDFTSLSENIEGKMKTVVSKIDDFGGFCKACHREVRAY